MKIKKLTLESISEWFVYVYLLSLFFILPSGYVHFARYRYIFFLTGYGVLTFVALLRIKELNRIAWTADQIFFLSYMAFAILSVAVSAHPLEGLYGEFRYDGMITYLIYGVIFFAVRSYFTIRPIHIRILYAVTVLYCMIGILQAFGRNPLWMYSSHNFVEAPKYHEGVFFSLTGNADHAAGFLCILTGIYIGLLIWGEKKERVLSLLMLVICIGTGIMSDTDSYLVGLTVGAVCAIPFIITGKKGFVRGMTISISLIIAGVLTVYFFDFPVGFLNEAHNILHGVFRDEYGSGRIFIWRQMIADIKEHPFFGCGFDNIGFLDLTPFHTYDPSLGKTFTSAITSAHNEYLQVLVCNGAFAFFFYLCFLASCLKNAIRSQEKPQRIAAIAMVFYLVQAFFTSSFLTVMPFFMMVCAIGAQPRSLY